MAGYEQHLKPFATKSAASRGRLYPEAEDASRSHFQRDRDRVVHCATFRRLKQKTQVFIFQEGDYYRTRLTHSIEVAQIARSICRSLGINDDLAEALALAHDFGHTPFGHVGGEALDAAMEPFGGFDHNAQSVRLVTKLERRYANFEGLNLTWETLEGLAKHNGPLCDGAIDPADPPASIPWGIREYLPLQDLEVHTNAGPEAQVVALSDDIAYNNHDIDDGLRAGLFSTETIAEVPLVGSVMAEVRSAYGDLESSIFIHEAVRRLINRMVVDLLDQSRERLGDLAPASCEAVRVAVGPVIAFSESMDADLTSLRSFLNLNMYQHERVNHMSRKGKRVVSDLFNLYIEEPERMPGEWEDMAGAPGSAQTARVVADFVAGMTDRYALRKHQKLFDR